MSADLSLYNLWFGTVYLLVNGNILLLKIG
jgi:hypothetical protein